MKSNHFLSSASSKRPKQSDVETYIKTKKLKLKKLQKQVGELQKAINAEEKHSVLIIFQAMDAAGKDSTIRNVFNYCDIAGLKNVSFKQPTKRESAQDFLWRCHLETPQKGDINIFNRSYYEEVLVVKVHPEWLGAQKIQSDINEEFWNRRYESINAFETHLANSGTKIIKFMLDVSQAEQHQRLIRRYNTPDKKWKFSLGDLRESQLWPQYQAAFDDLLEKTSTPQNPWYVIPADDKDSMRILVADIIKQELSKLNPKYPELEEFDAEEMELVQKLLKGKLMS